MKKILLVITTISLFFIQPVFAERQNCEKYYQDKWCKEMKGETEVVLPDRTRIDCETEKYAVEVGFANKWKDEIGQALHYSRWTGKTPGIVIIVEDPSDMKYWDHLNGLIIHYDLDIETWIIRPEEKDKFGPGIFNETR